MKNTIILLALFSSLGLPACDKTTVDKTPDTVVVPVPVPIAGPAGATGATGDAGEKGNTGQSGDEAFQAAIQPLLFHRLRQICHQILCQSRLL
jgi:hypothetical protein